MIYPALDGLRAVAVLMVFGSHYLTLPWGWAGVNVFFVLSGFLITGILLDTRDTPHRARNFYVRRTLRIFPLYYGIFLVLAILNPVLHWQWSLAWLAWPLYLGNFLRFRSPQAGVTSSPQELAANGHLTSLRLPNSQVYIGHFWSLCVEEQFYLLWPWIIFWIPSRRALLWVCGLTIVLVPCFRVAALAYAPPWLISQDLLFRSTPLQLDSLLLGALLALLLRSAHRALLLRAGRGLAYLTAALAAGYLALTVHSLDGRYTYPSWHGTWALSFINLLSAGVILCCLQPGNVFYSLLHLRPLRALGRISYGFYVLHDPLHGLYVHLVVHALHVSPGNPEVRPLCAVLALVCTLVLAVLSFRYFEAPFLNLKDRWTRR